MNSNTMKVLSIVLDNFIIYNKNNDKELSYLEQKIHYANLARVRDWRKLNKLDPILLTEYYKKHGWCLSSDPYYKLYKLYENEKYNKYEKALRTTCITLNKYNIWITTKKQLLHYSITA
jgi:hypothetical protein